MKTLLLAFTFLLSPALAQATFINGGFETGNFSGWSTIGDALVVDASFGTAPAGGTYQALVTNAPSLPLDGYQHPETYSGTRSVDELANLPFSPSPLEIFLGLPQFSLRNFAQAIGLLLTFEGSAIKQSFNAGAGSILTFNWNYLSQEQIDFAFIILDGTLSLLALSANLDSSTPILKETGYRTYATILPTSGTHYIGIGVVDGWNDWDGNSAVLVDNFSVQKVPEPASLFLVVLGLIAMVRMGRRISGDHGYSYTEI